jgi:AbrB family looped-hinge helix DNA binding protein
VELGLTRMSSKGQVVIPAELRKNIKEGEQLLIIKTDSQILLKKASDVNRQFCEDVEFAKRTDKALKKYRRGDFKEMDFDSFMKEMKKW